MDYFSYVGLNQLFQSSTYNSPEGQVVWYIRRAQQHNVLVFGASKSKHGIVTSAINHDWFNLARGGMREPYALCALSLIIESGLAPKGVVLGVSPELYYARDPQRKFTATSPLFFKYYYGKNDIVTRLIKEISYFEPIKFLSKSYRFNPNCINLVVRFLKEKRGAESPFEPLLETQGYEPLPPPTDKKSSNSWLADVATQAEVSKIERPVKLLWESRFRYLEEFLTLCEENNIEVAMVTLPQLIGLDPTYSSEALERLEQMAATRGNVVYIDLVKAHPLTLNWNSWSDRYHLSSEGAKLATASLVEQLEKEKNWKPFLGEGRSTSP